MHGLIFSEWGMTLPMLAEIKIADVGPDDYIYIKRLCDVTADGITAVPGNTIARPTFEQIVAWGNRMYRKQAVLGGKTVGFFYVSPLLAKRPKTACVEAFGIDPGLAYGIQRELGFRLIRTGIDDYMKVGAEEAVSLIWAESPACRVCIDLGLSLTVGSTNAQTGAILQYNLQVPLAEVDELLKKRGL